MKVLSRAHSPLYVLIMLSLMFKFMWRPLVDDITYACATARGVIITAVASNDCCDNILQAQNIKNFKSQRWQTLLAFNSQRRLLLTGTPLQNNLMELWSLMHFLMPSVFSSHSDFKEWFSNPLTGMVEGSQEYNDSIVKRLHQVCVDQYI